MTARLHDYTITSRLRPLPHDYVPYFLLRQRLRLIGRIGLVVEVEQPRPAAFELALPRPAHGLALRVRHDDVQEMQGTDLLRAMLLEREHVQRPRRARL